VKTQKCVQVSSLDASTSYSCALITPHFDEQEYFKFTLVAKMQSATELANNVTKASSDSELQLPISIIFFHQLTFVLLVEDPGEMQ
jgi:hypothetical protein